MWYRQRQLHQYHRRGNTPLQQGIPLFNPAVARPLFGVSISMSNRDYPYGMPMLMIDDLHTNMSIYSDNAMATEPSYNPHNDFALTIENMVD